MESQIIVSLTTNNNEKIHCTFEFSGSGTIRNNGIATQLFRVAQESLNNALKHGLANDIKISLTQHQQQIILEVCDNGVGFDPQSTIPAASARGGLGLRIMKYRANILGGELQVRRNSGPGITVRCTVPSISDLI